jgi:hypothetical protein
MKHVGVLIGSFVVFCGAGAGLDWVHRHNERDRDALSAALAASQKARDVRLMREVRAQQALEVTARAKTNMANWKQAFLHPTIDVAVCYHGHIFDDRVLMYEITCDVGMHGMAPTLKVVCNQDRCTSEEVRKTRIDHDLR